MSMLDQKALNMALIDLAEFGFVIVDNVEHALKIVKEAKRLGIHAAFRKTDGKIVIRDVQKNAGPRVHPFHGRQPRE